MANHGFPDRFEAVIEVRLSNGENLGQRIESVRGGPERPISEAEVLEKFRTNAGRVMSAGDGETLCGTILAIETVPTLARLTDAIGRRKS
jgi:hypothetical protein